MSLPFDVDRCPGSPEGGSTERRNEFCCGCERWRNLLNIGMWTPSIRPAVVWRIDEQGARFHCDNRIAAG